MATDLHGSLPTQCLLLQAQKIYFSNSRPGRNAIAFIRRCVPLQRAEGFRPADFCRRPEHLLMAGERNPGWLPERPPGDHHPPSAQQYASGCPARLTRRRGSTREAARARQALRCACPCLVAAQPGGGTFCPGPSQPPKIGPGAGERPGWGGRNVDADRRGSCRGRRRIPKEKFIRSGRCRFTRSI